MKDMKQEETYMDRFNGLMAMYEEAREAEQKWFAEVVRRHGRPSGDGVAYGFIDWADPPTVLTMKYDGEPQSAAVMLASVDGAGVPALHVRETGWRAVDGDEGEYDVVGAEVAPGEHAWVAMCICEREAEG